MTGFGRGTASSEIWHASVEISSVNRKQAEVVVQVPRELNELECRIRNNVLEALSRGRAVVSLTLEPAASKVPEVKIDAALAKALHQAFADLGSTLGQDLTPSVNDYLRQPGIITVSSGQMDPEATWLAIGPALGQAIAALVEMRSAEGGHLKDDFLARLGTLDGYASKIAEMGNERPQRQREMLLKRLRDSGLEIDLDDERLVREVAMFADRCDISEELTRLQSHFDKFRSYLESGEPCGRPLDFLCQELFREFNTIGSKANDADIAQTVVEAKTELEKIREQVQNVE